MNPIAEKYITDLLTPYLTGKEEFSLDANGECVYLSDSGNMCVFGKACIDVKKIKDDCSDASGVLSEYGKSILKPEGRMLSADEWVRIQEVHDTAARGYIMVWPMKSLDRLSHIGTFADLRTIIKKWYKEKAPEISEARPS